MQAKLTTIMHEAETINAGAEIGARNVTEKTQLQRTLSYLQSLDASVSHSPGPWNDSDLALNSQLNSYRGIQDVLRYNTDEVQRQIEVYLGPLYDSLE